MQIRSCEKINRVYDPIILDNDFPIFGGEKISIGKSPDFLHRHNVLEIGYCYEGCGVFVIGDNVYSFSAGDVCVINSGLFHIAQSSEDQDSIWAFLYVDPYRFSASLAPGYYIQKVTELLNFTHLPLFHGVDYPEISSAIWAILNEIQRKDSFFEISTGGLIASLMVKLFRIEGLKNKINPNSDNSAMEKIAPALHHIAMNYAGQIPVPILAELCCLSGAQIRRLFHLAVGQSPQSYIIKFRIGMSASLLNSTTLQILDIANRVGYASISSFNRHFKNQFGMSPHEWRGLCQDSKRKPARHE